MTRRIRLLGGLAVQDEAGAAVPLPTRKAGALLARLAVEPGRHVGRAYLCALLWPRSGEAQARGSLRQALAQVRRALGDEAVGGTHEHVWLVPSAVAVDVAEVTGALGGGTPAWTLRAAERYAGDLLAGFAPLEEPFDQWLREEALALRHRILDSLARALDDPAAEREPALAIALAERLVSLDPAAEEGYRGLMRAHLALGARAAALRAYERCRTALAATLDVPPAPETEELYRRIFLRPDFPSSAAVPPPIEDTALCVMPFLVLSAEEGWADLVQGFTLDLLDALSRFRPLRVVAWQSSFALAGLDLSPQEIGRRLGARWLVSGSVRRRGETVRITVALVDAVSGRQAWSDILDVPEGHFLDAQDAIVRRLAAVLPGNVDRQMLDRARQTRPENLDAYGCWLRGMAILRRGVSGERAEARTLFERALELDSHCVRARAGLSLYFFDDWSCLAWDRWEHNERMAYQHALEAVTLDDGDHVAQFILGRILIYRRQFARGREHLERALTLNPNDADLLAQAALAFAYLGEPERATECATLAMRLNPYHDSWYWVFCAAPHMIARRFELFVDMAVKAPDIAVDVRALLASACAHLGRTAEAAEHMAGFRRLFAEHIAGGADHAPDAPVRWLFRVNPLRRRDDRLTLAEGLRLCGLPVPDHLVESVDNPHSQAV